MLDYLPSRASYRKLKDWGKPTLLSLINEVLAKTPRAGFWKCFTRLRRQGPFNHQRSLVYCRLGLNLPRRVKRKLPKREPRPLEIGGQQPMGIDFMHDTLYCGKLDAERDR